jgi:hypothetical protein
MFPHVDGGMSHYKLCHLDIYSCQAPVLKFSQFNSSKVILTWKCLSLPRTIARVLFKWSRDKNFQVSMIVELLNWNLFYPEMEYFASASIARGRIFSDCGRKCGNLSTQVVEGNLLKDFHIMMLILTLFSLSTQLNTFKTWNIILNRVKIMEILRKPVVSHFWPAKEL